MDNRKPNQLSIKSENLITPQELRDIEYLLSTVKDGFIILDFEGRVIAINNLAAHYLHLISPLDNPYLINNLTFHTFSRKRKFIQVRSRFNAAKKGISQNYTWVEYHGEKPTSAYNILINKEELHDNAFIFVQISNVLPSKIIDWALWSLAKIENHYEITAIIDELLKLAANVFSAEHAAVCLIDSLNNSHAVSYYQATKKKENHSYPFISTFVEQIPTHGEMVHVNNAQKKFPQKNVLQQLNINSYLIGSIISVKNDVVGIFTLCTHQNLIKDRMTHTLFSLFLKRFNIEIQRLLDQRKLQFLASIPQQNPHPILRILPSGQVIFANNEGKDLLKFWSSNQLYLPKLLLDGIENVQNTSDIIRVELEVDNKFFLFTLIWIEEFQQINIYGTDISQLKLTEHKMLAMARFDALTQIANRQYFEEVLKQKLIEHQQQHLSLALLLIDLDNFKAINDTLGHSAGDALLREATKRMLQSLRQEDFLARLGGDEFIVILNDTNVTNANKVAQKMLHLLSQTFHFGESQMHVTASLGIALYPHTGLTSSDLLKYADIAMYAAKNSGKNTFSVFSSSTHYEQNRRNEFIKRDLKFAADKKQLFIQYQPQIDIIDHKITGFEAFLRWHHPKLGLLLPCEFIPLAEQTGCIHILGRWLFNQTLQDYTAIIAADAEMELTLNIALSQLNDARFLEQLKDTLEVYNIAKKNITLDISEYVWTQHSQLVIQSLKKIKNEEIKLCMDNFGSSNASLLQLINLPIDSLKLDSQLLVNIENHEKHRILLKNLSNLTQELQLKVIQKGIETEGQHLLIKSLGYRYAQGYYYCRPIRVEQINSFVKQFFSNV
jgi:diguanylate cyclase (GGDEF)-like protein